MSPLKVVTKFPKNISISAILTLAALAILFVLVVWFYLGYQYDAASILPGTIEGIN